MTHTRDMHRHHRQRIYKRRLRQWADMPGILDTKWFKILIDTPQGCSCDMCGNRRKWAGRTKQEKIAEDEMEEEIKEIEEDKE